MDEIEKKYLRLLNPGMGTENVGPLIYNLIQIIRPEKVLEVGLGYSTALIAEGLSKLKTDFEAKAVELCTSKGNHNVLRKNIEILDIDETPAYGLETKVKLEINGVVECKEN